MADNLGLRPDYHIPLCKKERERFMEQMAENERTAKKKPIELIRVKIALVLCVIGVITPFLPWINFSDRAVLYYSNIKQNTYSLFGYSQVESPYLIMGIILLACFVLTAVFFLTDHPKLSLIGSIPATIAAGLLCSILSDYSSNEGYMTAFPYVALGCSAMLIIMAIITKKANPKHTKEKAK